ncbi:NUDIX hydrolase [Bacteroidota bacterium]|nr:NUDIX hydrolase [Bacteroidota bacterium]MEC7005495.1 NUDIX hydrolase [Bacteroidota bacterium]MEC7617980.1 NUDIX hydrolase [Bacteroidota bacterium]MEC7814186.1 NUDIX hydrolase [Bacteroidota bacterium]MEC8005242.1 NUDIX hydrolase [Bacteroidota bacterium]|tara:strand:+ start:33 stop:458 length:426 start_codon:yes stop_codon:yes gene_type:complete
MKILRIRAGSVILNHKNEILLIFRKGKWDLPKGKVSKKGKLLSVAINESIEETGLKKKNLKLIKPLSKSSSVKKDGIILDYWFLLEYEGKKLELKPQTEEGISDYRWVSKKDIIKYYPYFRKYVCEVLRYYLLEKEKSKKS